MTTTMHFGRAHAAARWHLLDREGYPGEYETRCGGLLRPRAANSVTGPTVGSVLVVAPPNHGLCRRCMGRMGSDEFSGWAALRIQMQARPATA